MKTRFILLTLAGFLFFSVLPAQADHFDSWPFTQRKAGQALEVQGISPFLKFIKVFFFPQGVGQQPSTRRTETDEDDKKKAARQRLEAVQKKAETEESELPPPNKPTTPEERKKMREISGLLNCAVIFRQLEPEYDENDRLVGVIQKILCYRYDQDTDTIKIIEIEIPGDLDLDGDGELDIDLDWLINFLTRPGTFPGFGEGMEPPSPERRCLKALWDLYQEYLRELRKIEEAFAKGEITAEQRAKKIEELKKEYDERFQKRFGTAECRGVRIETPQSPQP